MTEFASFWVGLSPTVTTHNVQCLLAARRSVKSLEYSKRNRVTIHYLNLEIHLPIDEYFKNKLHDRFVT